MWGVNNTLYFMGLFLGPVIVDMNLWGTFPAALCWVAIIYGEPSINYGALFAMARALAVPV